MSQDLHKNYINGQWLGSSEMIDNINPSDISDCVIAGCVRDNFSAAILKLPSSATVTKVRKWRKVTFK